MHVTDPIYWSGKTNKPTRYKSVLPVRPIRFKKTAGFVSVIKSNRNDMGGLQLFYRRVNSIPESQNHVPCLFQSFYTDWAGSHWSAMP